MFQGNRLAGLKFDIFCNILCYELHIVEDSFSLKSITLFCKLNYFIIPALAVSLSKTSHFDKFADVITDSLELLFFIFASLALGFKHILQ